MKDHILLRNAFRYGQQNNSEQKYLNRRSVCWAVVDDADVSKALQELWLIAVP